MLPYVWGGVGRRGGAYVCRLPYAVLCIMPWREGEGCVSWLSDSSMLIYRMVQGSVIIAVAGSSFVVNVLEGQTCLCCGGEGEGTGDPSGGS